MPTKRLTQAEYAEYERTGVVPASYYEKRKAQRRNPAKYKKQVKEANRTYRKKRALDPYVFWGLDGEGVTEHGVHRYNLLVAAPFVADPKTIPRNSRADYEARVLKRYSINSFEALYWLTEPLPGKSRLVTFSFNYDLTKILEDLDPSLTYELFRPELRKNSKGEGFYPVLYPARHAPPFLVGDKKVWFKLDWLNGKFSVSRYEQKIDADPESKPKKFGPVIIFDLFKFFGKAFLGAIADWKVPRASSDEARQKLHDFIKRMKNSRSLFAQMTGEEVLEYCILECRMLGELATLLVDSHHQAGIPLSPNALYGAGSSGDAMLKALGVGGTRKKPGYCQQVQALIQEYPPELLHAIMCAFVGGRFEHSVIGVVPANTYSGDISSAYPYHCCFLPDLMRGEWSKTTDRNRIERAATAVVHYKLHEPSVKRWWAPFPYRVPLGLERGSIIYPESGSEGWVWREEFLAGERGWSNVEFVEAWVFETESDYLPLAKMAQYYRERLKHGKEAVGLSYKLGLNSGGYGKFAQTMGGELGKYTNWVWAGMITSGCRGQMLDVFNLHRDMDNMIMVATDGYVSRENVKDRLPIPRNTGTFDCLNEKGLPANKPLGGWEHKVITKDMAFIRPGIYFPLDPTSEEIDKMRARGIGRNNLARNWARIVRDLEREGVFGESVIGEVSTFHGAKTSIYRVPSKLHPGKLRVEKSPLYGQWTSEQRVLSFDPTPKRAAVAQDGYHLMLRVVTDGAPSAPYMKNASDFAKKASEYQQTVIEQPDYDWFDNMFEEYMALNE